EEEAMRAETPEACDELFTRFANARDLEGLVSLYESEACLAQAEGPPARGTAAIRASLAEFLAGEPELEMKVVRRLPAGAGLAVPYSDSPATVRGPDGRKVPVSGRSMIAVRRQRDGGWRIAVDDPYSSR